MEQRNRLVHGKRRMMRQAILPGPQSSVQFAMEAQLRFRKASPSWALDCYTGIVVVMPGDWIRERTVMIPAFMEEGFLPEGIHTATRKEFEERFVVFDSSDRRFRIYDKLAKLLDEAVKSEIVKRVIMAGSFVTDKAEPNDYDCLLVLDASVTGRVLRPFEYNLVSRKAARRIFGGDVVPAIEGSEALDEYLEFFQTTRGGQRVGVVEVEL